MKAFFKAVSRVFQGLINKAINVLAVSSAPQALKVLTEAERILRWLEGVPGSPGKSQNEEQEEQETLKQLGRSQGAQGLKRLFFHMVSGLVLQFSYEKNRVLKPRKNRVLKPLFFIRVSVNFYNLFTTFFTICLRLL